MSPEFLWFWLRFREHALASLGTGSTFTAISRRHLDDLDVPVPSRSEQQRIVARIEELLAHVKNARDRLARVKAIMKRFRQAVLTAAVSGRLTADWRGTNVENNTESGLPESWELLSLGTLADSIRGGSTEVPTRDKTSYPILRSSSVRPFAIDYADVRHLRAEQSERDENFVKDGDLLITRLSGSIDYVGNCALVRSLNGRRIQYPDRLFCCRLRDPAEAPFVELFFAGPSMRRQIEDASRSAAGHQRISISDLQGFTIARPPIDEQREVVRRVEALFALADNIERRLDATAASAETLTQAILAKAFRGELVDSAQRPAFNDRPVDTDPRSDVRSVPRARERP
jgi:type I restriction enzyme S subunit